MLIYEYKLCGNKQQDKAMDEAIRVVQFIRNKCVRLWMDERGISRNDLQCYCAILAKQFSFAARLNSQARQASADRAWAAISRFYENCRNKKKGKKGYPRFQHDNRSVEYKRKGWKHDFIAFEDLRISNMVKNRRLAKSISDASWGRFLQWVKYYGTVHEIPVIAVPPRFTSQNCSGCGKRVKKSLSVRTHICPTCGLILDRDHNAARNTLQAGLLILLLQTFTGTVGQTETFENASGQSASTRPSRRGRTGKRSG